MKSMHQVTGILTPEELNRAEISNMTVRGLITLLDGHLRGVFKNGEASTKPTSKMLKASRTFVDTMIEEYQK